MSAVSITGTDLESFRVLSTADDDLADIVHLTCGDLVMGLDDGTTLASILTTCAGHLAACTPEAQ